jgi:hypothetical protein
LVHPAIDHIEKTLADNYRKEIDQEENIWRSLPFFAATLALELAALFQLITQFPPLRTGAGRASLVLLILAGLSMGIALCLLAACIAPVRFLRISREPLLLRYTDELIDVERMPENQGQDEPLDALATLKRELAHQFSLATDHNTRINKRRERLRAFAGLAVVWSVLMLLLLAAVAFGYHIQHIPSTSNRGGEHGAAHAVTSPNQPTDRAPQPAPSGSPAAVSPGSSPGPANADHH